MIVSASERNHVARVEWGADITHVIKGDYPSNDPGVVLYHVKSSADDNTAWMIPYYHVIAVGQRMLTGDYPTERLVVLAGSRVTTPQHFVTREGVSVAHLTQNQLCDPQDNARFIAGGCLRDVGRHWTAIWDLMMWRFM